jgi:hypothetical protein
VKVIKEVYFKKDKPGRGNKYLWAWKESADVHVFGGANTLREIKRRAGRMYPNHRCVLLPLRSLSVS